MGFNYQPGLWTLLALVPFIILYLIRPKHRKLKIPSLMFLLGENQSKKKVNFFRNLLKDPLILVQLALLLALAFAVAEPFLLLNKQEVATNTALVIDASASSQAMFNGRSRFEQSVEKAHDYVGGKMSIVLASQVPEIILEDGGKLQARNLLRTLRPSDTTTNIAGAMFLAKDILNGKKGQVIVFSDFITTSPEDNVLVAKRALNAQGIQVKFVNIFEPLDNIGIVDMEISNANVKSTIKNYGDAIKEVEINLVKDDAVEESTKITLAGNSVEFISFPTLSGISSIKINAQDPFLLDNTGYVSSPLGEKISVLMLTNDKDNFLRKALEAANIFHVEIREPPIVKAFELSHDIIIITDVTKTIVPS
ncbi:MAG: BatA and WFA domain-containing protein, partial [Candidatus Woesearchaeota archaeon]|nr:BatA and WFA domain-containing protein [Candidatus Woesearchaeota archaeon]